MEAHEQLRKKYDRDQFVSDLIKKQQLLVCEVSTPLAVEKLKGIIVIQPRIPFTKGFPINSS